MDAVSKLGIPIRQDPVGSRVARAMVRRTIRDLGNLDKAIYVDAKRFIYDESFPRMCTLAGYPSELLDTLHGLVTRSKAERTHLATQVLEILRTEWDTLLDKKNPPLGGV
jgi:hypothetical protein